VKSLGKSALGETRAQVTFAGKRKTPHRVPFIFMNGIETQPLLVEPSAHMQQHGPVCQVLADFVL
jgi:hypothetical protein